MMELGETRIAAGRATLDGSLIVPERAEGVVLFAHGSGSRRASSAARRDQAQYVPKSFLRSTRQIIVNTMTGIGHHGKPANTQRAHP